MPKCVVPWCQICGAVVPNMWCRGAKNVVPAGAEISLKSGEI